MVKSNWEESMALIGGIYGRVLRYLYYTVAFKKANEDTPESYRRPGQLGL